MAKIFFTGAQNHLETVAFFLVAPILLGLEVWEGYQGPVGVQLTQGSSILSQRDYTTHLNVAGKDVKTIQMSLRKIQMSLRFANAKTFCEDNIRSGYGIFACTELSLCIYIYICHRHKCRPRP